MTERTDSSVTELKPGPRERGESFYVVGGPVQPRRDCYLERTADRQLLARLLEGEYCHVLAPRQTGKSSLVARAARSLRREGYLTAVVDLSQTVGRERDSEAGRWYYGIAYRIVRELRLGVDLQHWWQEKKPLTTLQRISEFFWEVVLAETRAPVVIFLDEVESVEDLEHAADLFLAVRAAHDARASEPDYERLRFVLLGSALPAEQKGPKSLSLFDVGRRVDLRDFSFEEARPLCRELGLEPGDAERALYRIFYWTGGHPYLTQKLCRAVARCADKVDSDEAVDELVRSRFFAGNAPQNEPNLRATRQMVCRRDKLAQAALRLYRRIRRGRRVRHDPHSPLQEFLLTGGLVKLCEDRRLQVRNRIYAQVFNSRWARQSVSFNWRRAATAAVVAALLVGVPWWYARVLPRPYVETLKVATVDYGVAVEAYRRLRRLPGFGGTADDLFAGVLERRSLQADTWDEALEADVTLRALEGYGREANELLAAFWDRRAAAAEASEYRDRALIYRLRADETATPDRDANAAILIDGDYPALLSTLRPGAVVDALAMDPTGNTVVTLSGGHVFHLWRAVDGEALGPPAGVQALAEEFVPVRRRLGVEATGRVRDLRLSVSIQHPRPADLVLRLVAPDGRTAVLPVRRVPPAGEPLLFEARGEPGLAALKGTPAQGTWTLEVEDQHSGATGVLAGWALRLSSAEGHALADQPATPILVPDPGPTSRVATVLSPDGRRVAAFSADPAARGYLQIWDVGSGTVAARVPMSAGRRAVAFDARGLFLVTGGERAEAVTAWHAASGQAALEVTPRDGFLTDPVLSVAGSVMAIADGRPGRGARVRRWDLDARRELPAFRPSGEIAALAVGPDGAPVAVMDRQHVVRVWDPDGGTLLAEYHEQGPVARLGFDPGGRWLVVQDDGGQARFWPLGQPGPMVTPMVWESADPLALSFGQDGGRVVLRSRGRSFDVLDPDTGAVIGPLRHSGVWFARASPGRAGALTPTAFSADGTRLATGRGGSTVRVWDLSRLPRQMPAMPGSETAWAVNPAGFQLAVGGVNGRVRFMDRGQPWGAEADVTMPAHGGPVTGIAYSGDGSRLASVGADGSVLLWDAATRTPLGGPLFHSGGTVAALALDGPGETLLTGGTLGARIWNPADGSPGPVLGPTRRVEAVALDPLGRLAATAAEDGEIQLWAVASGALEWSTPVEGRVSALAIRADGREVAAATASGAVVIHSRGIVDEPPRSRLINGPVLAMRYAGRGSRLLVQTSEWLHLLDLSRGAPRVVASRLLPGLLPAGAWQVNDEAGRRVTVADDVRGATPGLRVMDLLDPASGEGAPGNPGNVDAWLERLRLRFEAGGTVVSVAPGSPAWPERGSADAAAEGEDTLP